MNIDPIEGEFFSTEALDSLTDALVREAIQNSLDARRSGERLRMRIAFPAPVDPAVAGRWLAGLRPHLGAARSGLAALPDPEASVPCLVVEDFGTRGLQGRPGQSEDQELDEEPARNDFYYFWRNVGRSRKGLADLGRWGLGKTVFPAASRINAFLGLTVRSDDGRRLLMGQSVLRIHRLDGGRYYPYGYFGFFDDDFACPVEEPDLLDLFRDDFGLARDGEPGLSVVVPWPEPEVAPAAVLPSVLRHYFVPILAGDLAVEIDADGRVERLDAESLPDLLDGSGRNVRTAAPEPGPLASLEPMVTLARCGLALARDAHVRLSVPPRDRAPRWDIDCLDDAPEGLRERFDAGAPLGFTVPVWVKPADGEAVLSEFDVYLQRDESLARAEEHFVREGIAVAGVRGAVPRGVRAIVIAADRPIATLLGDAENPAHTEWQERSPKFRNRYRHGPFTLRYVRNAPRAIARALTRHAAGRSDRLLQHLFSLEVPTEAALVDPRAARTETPGQGESAVREVGQGAGAERAFQLQKLGGGFRLVGSRAAPAPPRALVEVAYEVRRGNPFAQYQPPDFTLGEGTITVGAEGATVERRSGNALVLRIDDPGFRLTVEGFDPHRDVRVRISPVVEPGAT